MFNKLKNWIRNFMCHTMDWHNPSGNSSFDGCSFVSHCKYCGRKILMDSQGNWFSVTR